MASSPCSDVVKYVDLADAIDLESIASVAGLGGNATDECVGAEKQTQDARYIFVGSRIAPACIALPLIEHHPSARRRASSAVE